MKGRNVYSLDTPYAQQKTAQQAADKAYARKIHKRRFLAMIGIIGVFVLVFGVQIWKNQRQLGRVNAQIQQTQTQLTKQKSKQKQLNSHIKEMNDPEYLQQLIRSKYNYAKKGETIYNFAN